MDLLSCSIDDSQSMRSAVLALRDVRSRSYKWSHALQRCLHMLTTVQYKTGHTFCFCFFSSSHLQ